MTHMEYGSSSVRRNSLEFQMDALIGVWWKQSHPFEIDPITFLLKNELHQILSKSINARTTWCIPIEQLCADCVERRPWVVDWMMQVRKYIWSFVCILMKFVNKCTVQQLSARICLAAVCSQFVYQYKYVSTYEPVLVCHEWGQWTRPHQK